MADPKHYIRQGSIDDENFLYLARKLGHHLNALNASIENLDTSATYNDLKKEIEDLKSVVEAIEEYDDTELREELQSLKDAIDAIEEYDDTELKEELTALQGELVRVDGYITQLNTSITNIETSANNHYTLYDSAIEGIHESLNDLEEQINNIGKTEIQFVQKGPFSVDLIPNEVGKIYFNIPSDIDINQIISIQLYYDKNLGSLFDLIFTSFGLNNEDGVACLIYYYIGEIEQHLIDDVYVNIWYKGEV